MATTTLKSIIKPRRNTLVGWNNSATVLRQYEIGLVVDTGSAYHGSMKIGNGTSAWSSLPWAIDTSKIGAGSDISIDAVTIVANSSTGEISARNSLLWLNMDLSASVGGTVQAASSTFTLYSGKLVVGALVVDVNSRLGYVSAWTGSGNATVTTIALPGSGGGGGGISLDDVPGLYSYSGDINIGTTVSDSSSFTKIWGKLTTGTLIYRAIDPTILSRVVSISGTTYTLAPFNNFRLGYATYTFNMTVGQTTNVNTVAITMLRGSKDIGAVIADPYGTFGVITAIASTTLVTVTTFASLNALTPGRIGTYTAEEIDTMFENIEGGGSATVLFQGAFTYFGTYAQINALSGVSAGSTAITSDTNQRGNRGSSSWTWQTLAPAPVNGMYAYIDKLIPNNNEPGQIIYKNDGVNPVGWVIREDLGIRTVLNDDKTIKGNGKDVALVSNNSYLEVNSGFSLNGAYGDITNIGTGNVTAISGDKVLGAIVYDPINHIVGLVVSLNSTALQVKTIAIPGSGGGGGGGSGGSFYVHNIVLRHGSATMFYTGQLLTESSNTLNSNVLLAQALYDNGFVDASHIFHVTGSKTSSSSGNLTPLNLAVGLYSPDGETFYTLAASGTTATMAAFSYAPFDYVQGPFGGGGGSSINAMSKSQWDALVAAGGPFNENEDYEFYEDIT
jgi:hypothetical protein